MSPSPSNKGRSFANSAFDTSSTRPPAPTTPPSHLNPSIDLDQSQQQDLPSRSGASKVYYADEKFPTGSLEAMMFPDTSLRTIALPCAPTGIDQEQRNRMVEGFVDMRIRNPSAAIPASLSGLTFEEHADDVAVLTALASEADTQDHLVRTKAIDPPTLGEMMAGVLLFGGSSRTGDTSGCLCGTCPTARNPSRDTNGGGRPGSEQPAAEDDSGEDGPDDLSAMFAGAGLRQRPRRG